MKDLKGRRLLEALLICGLLVVFFPPSGLLSSRIITVSNDPDLADYVTIQDAINAAVDGDVVMVRDGTYTGIQNVDLDFCGKAITVRSENGAEKCILQGQESYNDGYLGSTRGFYFHSGESAGSVVSGFTIRHFAQAMVFESASPTITQCIVARNCEREAPGVLAAASSSPTFTQCSFTENAVPDLENGTSSSYLFLASQSSSVSLVDCSFSRNYTYYVFYSHSSSLGLSRCSIQGAASNIVVGGSNATVSIADSTFVGYDETVADWRPTGVYMSGSSLTLTNTGISGTGTGVYGASSSGIIRNCTISGSQGTGCRGIALFDSSFTILDSRIRDNTNTSKTRAEGSPGGGLYLMNSSSTVLENCTISGNKAAEGGGISIEQGAPTIARCTITGNQSTSGLGGGIAAYTEDPNSYPCTPTVTNCNLTGNIGGAFHSNNSAPILTNCTLFQNPGGGLKAVSSSAPVVVNSILWGNTPGETSVDETSTLVITYSDVSGGYAGEGNINADPLLVSANCWLSADSPCVNTGDNGAPLLPATDRVGGARMVGGTVDMGSYEYNASGPPIADFSADVTLGPAPLAVQFEDASGGNITEWSWDFGDTGSSSIPNPAHVFSFTGTYTVTLTVSGPNGSDSEIKTRYITVGKNLYVPDEYATIQGAVDAAKNGDCVVVKDGTYAGAGNTQLSLKGKVITLRSENGPEHCVIDGGGAVKGFDLHLQEGPSSVISGFTVTNCTSAVVLSSSSPTLRNCLLQGNTAAEGGGVKASDSSAVFSAVTVRGNTANTGGGMHFKNSQPTLTNCIVAGNTATTGGGIYLTDVSNLTATNCTFHGNNSRALWAVGSSALLTNCIVWANLPSEMVKDATSAFTVSYSDVKGGMAGTGNLNLDPKLLAPEIGNYHLMRTSPCIDTGQNESAPETDREGTLRPADGNGDGTPVVDMGAYEGLPTNLALVPRSGWEVNGIEGGPFSPDMKQYQVANVGDAAFSWAVAWSAEWITGDRTSGTLAPGESDLVTFVVNELPDQYAYGSYPELITFRDLTESQDITLAANLKVKPSPGILSVTPAGEVHIEGNPGGPFAPSTVIYTVANVGHEPLTWTVSEVALWLDLSPTGGTLAPGASTQINAAVNPYAGDYKLGSYPAYLNFINTTGDTGSTSRSLVLDVRKYASSISCNLSASAILLGESVVVSGKITPAPSASGAFVSIALSPPFGTPLYRSVVANAQGEFSYEVQCADITQGGSWSVRTGWNGDELMAGAQSDAGTLTVSKATDSVTIDAGSKAVKMGEPVDIGGKFTPFPDCGRNLSGLSVTLLITGPGGRWESRSVVTNDPFGHFVLPGYTGFNALGLWNVQAMFPGNEAYESSASEAISVQVVETAGYAVVVEGKIWSEEGLASHNKTANFVYDQLIQRGLLAEDIQYFNYDTAQQGVTGSPTKAAIQQAVTQWARDKMNAKPANLYLVLVDHGSTDTFYIDPEVITAQELASWLTTLQESLEGDAVLQEIVVLLGFCRSGSFLPSLGGWKRVCIASAAAEEASYKGPLDPGEVEGVRDGEFFITEFFKAAGVGKNLQDCFLEASEKTRLFTSSGTGEPNGPYPDDAKQHPLLEDNGDGTGVVEPGAGEGEDGFLSRRLYLGVSSVTHNDPGDVQVLRVGEAQFLTSADTAASFWAGLSNNTRMRSLWIEVKSPGFAPQEGGTEQVEMDLPAHMYESYNAALDRYEWAGVADFQDPGTYQVFFFARDNVTGNLSSLKEGIVYKAKDGNQAPAGFDLLSPADGEEVPTTLTLLWSETTDPEGGSVTYTVEIAADSGFTDVVHRAERLSETRYLVESQAGLQDLTTYYWRVIAVDSYGAKTPSNQVRHFDTNNTNANFAWINSHVTDAATRVSLTGAVLKAGTEPFVHVGSGHYQVKLDLGGKQTKTVTLTAQAGGYAGKTYENVVVQLGKYTNRDFALESGSNKAAKPTFAPTPKVYTTPQNVSISCVTSGATIRYTADGTEPTASSTVYTAPIEVSATTTLKARAFKTDWEPSDTASGTYTITGKVAKPTFAPTPGSYTTPQNVTISCATSGATIRYTTNGTEPTASSTVYTASIEVSATTTLKAKAFKTNWEPSDTASGTYTIGQALRVLSPNGGEKWTRGETREIRWSYLEAAGTQVKIELVEGVTVTVLDSAVSIGEGGFGSYLWTLTQPLSSNCRIRITSLGDANCTDTSDGKFSILKPVIQVAVPIQGAVWKRGNIPRIKWTYTGDPGPNVRILLLKAGKRVAVISGGAPIGTAGKGSFTGWRIPRTLKAGNDYQVRVLSTQTTTVSGKSALFSIQ